MTPQMCGTRPMVHAFFHKNGALQLGANAAQIDHLADDMDLTSNRVLRDFSHCAEIPAAANGKPAGQKNWVR